MEELRKFYIWWLFRQKSPWTGEGNQQNFLSTMCCVYWVYHQYSKKKEPISVSSRFSFSPHRSQTVTAMISISPPAILALDISSFALFGQLCILYVPPGILLQMLSSQPIKIWSKVQYSQCKFSRPVLKCWRGRARGCLGQSSLSLTYWAHIPCTLFWEHWLQSTEHHLLMQISDWRALLGILFSISKVLFHAQNCLALIIPSQVLDFEQNCMKIYVTVVNYVVFP